ncbi:putative Fe-S metabolism associated domain, SufE [Helianthus annuus]|uniref:Fe-S metabolism associated domain, SufE n=1 Tax=Helianthus annuus TaxID=4232 RepID=A0A251RTU4_HELAN|nr:putative Fe-S metabolism associated domain, SufE [Helianthus annuus]KAJ0430574.1 putative Fe-S metabolism associated domain, SufE [Helianthus annuus]KAJ0633886.1 putative Fe-S metabolism associated domain, SufE [Helianthus annuus]
MTPFNKYITLLKTCSIDDDDTRLRLPLFKPVNFDILPSSPPISISTNPRSTISCSVVTVTPVTFANSKLQTLTAEFNSISEPIDRVKRLIQYASQLPQLDDSVRVPANRVMGCMAQVWLDVRMDLDEMMRVLADSDSEITKGFCSCLISVLDGATPEEVLGMKTEDLGDLNVAGLHGTKVDSRVNT